MIIATVNIVGVKVKGRTLVNRKQLCEILDIKSTTFTNKLISNDRLKSAKIETEGGEMFDLEKALGIKVQTKQKSGSS